MFACIPYLDGKRGCRSQSCAPLSLIALIGVMPASVAGEPASAPIYFQAPVVHHSDQIEVDDHLTLTKLVDHALAQYPDMNWLAALEEEAAAIRHRGESWFSGAPKAGLRFQEATSGTLHHVDAVVEVPLWNPGQRDAEQKLAGLSQRSAELQTQATRLRVAGLVRMALWDMALQTIRFEQAQAEVKVYEKLLANIKRRVALGDLPRADELLAHSELLQKNSMLNLAEAELMHARKSYQTITQTTKIPADFHERQAGLLEIQNNHPALLSLNAQIARKQAELNALKLEGAGPTQLAVGINSDRPSNQDPRSNDTESFNIAVIVPFGGSAHLAPKLAAAHVDLNRFYAGRDLLVRHLEQTHHEAEHNLEVNRVEVEIAENLKHMAEQHLAMMDKAFEAGEIGLMDLLKFHARTEQARLNAKERKVMLERDLAFYNQAVGIMP